MKMEESNTMTKEEMMAKVEFLKEQLSGDMFEDMDIKDEIHNLQMKIDDDSIRVVKRDQSAGSNRGDYQLLYALKRCFINVKSPYKIF